MRDLINFDFHSRTIRVIADDNGDPWFVARDVCDLLGHTNSSVALQSLDDDEKGVRKVYTLGGEQPVSIISEGGLYTLLLRSNKPEAKPLRKWVTSEVLPEIRRTGGFNLPKTMAEALTLAGQLASQNEQLVAQVGAMEPKAQFYNDVADANGLHSMEEAAKVIGTGRNRLFETLRNMGILKSDNLPYQEHLDTGRFRVLEQTYYRGEYPHISRKTYVTGRGMTWLHGLFNQSGQTLLPLN